MNFRSIDHMNRSIREKLYLIPKDVDLVVGIPRSGMLPASIIALNLNLPLMDMNLFTSQSDININRFTNRLKDETVSGNGWNYKKVLVVDDSCNHGNSINNAKRALEFLDKEKVEILYSCIYATSVSKEYVDIYFDICEQPRLFEWNIMNHYTFPSFCVDMDGVLCVDPTEEENDDGEKYIEFILNAKPLYIPKYPIGAIITSRLEKYREYTEIWLKKHGVKYGQLIMLNLKSKEERVRLGAHAKFKAHIYGQIPNAKLYIESNPKQAREIHTLTNKPVYCVESNEFWEKEESLENLEQYLKAKEKYDVVKMEVNGVLESVEEIKEYFEQKQRMGNENNGMEDSELLRLVYDACSSLKNTVKALGGSKQQLDSLECIVQMLEQKESNECKINKVLQYDFDKIDVIFNEIISGKLIEYAQKVSGKEWNIEFLRMQKRLVGILFSNGYFDIKYKNEIEYIRKKGKLVLYPYPFEEKYKKENIKVYLDKESGFKYVIHNNKRLYFPPRREEEIQEQYNYLIMKQDKESPHTYFDEKCNVKQDTIFVDVGSAEGIIALDVLDKASEIYLIECSEDWIKALELTFKGYEDKIHIIKKYAGRVDNENMITLNSLLDKYNDKDIFIKMDVEGMELEVLKGAKNVLNKNNCQLSCATYHTNNAENELKEFFGKQNYDCYGSAGYMLFFYGRMVLQNGKYERIRTPYFRKALVRALKTKRNINDIEMLK